MYKHIKEIKDDLGNVLSPALIFRKTDSSWIPLNEENIDYQKVLKWVAEGNTIEEAD
tara:strand:- start:7 stop:177 length:171 start_codon:yes stop_codon:yes gene_type:complete